MAAGLDRKMDVSGWKVFVVIICAAQAREWFVEQWSGAGEASKADCRAVFNKG